MEEYLIYASIGGLLFLMLSVDSIAEAYEIRMREKRIKILKIKHSLDEISNLLERLKIYSLPAELIEILLNEVIARLQQIQRIDRNFNGIQTLLDEAHGQIESEETPPSPVENIVHNEAEFKKIMLALRHLIKQLGSPNWISRVKREQLQQYLLDMKIFRCEKIAQFYNDKANTEIKNKRFVAAKEAHYFIINALKTSGAKNNPRLLELYEQSDFMLKEISKKMAKNMKKLAMEQEAATENSEAVKEEVEKVNTESKIEE